MKAYQVVFAGIGALALMLGSNAYVLADQPAIGTTSSTHADPGERSWEEPWEETPEGERLSVAQFEAFVDDGGSGNSGKGAGTETQADLEGQGSTDQASGEPVDVTVRVVWCPIEITGTRIDDEGNDQYGKPIGVGAYSPVLLHDGEFLEPGEELYAGDIIAGGVLENVSELSVLLEGPHGELTVLEPGERIAIVGSPTPVEEVD